MRRPQRAVVDDHVDRPQVEAQRCAEPSGTNCPRACAQPREKRGARPSAAVVRAGRGDPKPMKTAVHVPAVPFPPPQGPSARRKWRPLRRGAPLPIPNREVKPRRADDTASLWESRSPPTFNENPDTDKRRGFLFVSYADFYSMKNSSLKFTK